MESIDNSTGERVDKTEWHRIVTFQDGLITMFEKHARKGRLVYIDGKLQTRRWSKPGEDGDRFSTEILLVPGGRVQFLDKPNGANGNGSGQPATEPANGSAMPAGGTPASSELDDDIRSENRHPSSSLWGRYFGAGPIFRAVDLESVAVANVGTAAARSARQSPASCPPNCPKGPSRFQTILLPL